MHKTQHLSVPEHKLDGFSPNYLDQFVSEGVFAKDGPHYAFGHESFFDYCFARLFANEETLLTTELKSSEQHLFRRSQVRQVLVYLREEDFVRYVRELEALVSDEGIRAHIKDLIFALLATFEDPRDDEWDIWRVCAEPQLAAREQGSSCQDGIAARAWQRIFDAKSWFKQFDERGMIAGWLKADSPSADLAIEYLSWQQRYWPDRVAEHLEPYADRHGEWALRLQNIFSTSEYGASRLQFDIFLRLLDNGAFNTGIRSEGGVWRIWRRLGDGRVQWVPEVVAHLLRRCSHELQHDAVPALADALRHGLVRGSSTEAIGRAAEHHPRTFICHVLPAVLELADAAAKIGSGPPARDVVWPHLIKGAYSLADACLVALTDALANLACSEDDLRDKIEVLVRKQTYVANHLLLAVYRGGGRRYADVAAMEFSSSPWRFHCGYSDSPYWCATETLKAIAPHCSTASLANLERVILSYVDPDEKKKERVRWRGWAAFNLLSAIPSEFRSDHANRRIQELQRKFRTPATAPRGIVAGIVESPIAAAAADNMDDEGWLGAIAAYPSAKRERSISKDDWLRGGAWELASVFGKATEEEPERFARLGLRLPPDTNPVYFSALLRGLAETTIDQNAKVAVCQKAFEHARAECGSDIADLLAKANAPLPDHALDMLVWLAEAEDLEQEEQWKRESDSGQFYFDGDIDANGINTTRGRAALALGELILKDGGYVQRLEPVLGGLVRVRSAAVASCVAYALRTVAYHDAALGVDLFLRMDFSEERLLGTHHVHKFMRENVRSDFNRMKYLIVRMLRCPDPDVSRAGSRLGCMAALLSHRDALELAEESRLGRLHQRLGSADVAAANVGVPECRQWCEDALRTFFVDGEVEVRKVAASCFRHIPESDLATYEGLIGAFCNSPAYEDDAFALVNTLKNARAPLPGMTHLACERLLDRTERLGSDTWGVSELAFRLYQQHPNDEWTEPALDLIDRLCLEAPAEAAQGLEDFER